MIKLIVVLAVLFFGGRWLISGVIGMFDQALDGVVALLAIAWVPGLGALAYAAWRLQMLRSISALFADKPARIAIGTGLAAIVASMIVPDPAPPKALSPGVEKAAGLARARGVPGPIVDKVSEKAQEALEKRQAAKAAAAAGGSANDEQPTTRRAIVKDALNRKPDTGLKPGQFPGDQYRELGIEPNSPLAARLSRENSKYGLPLDRTPEANGRPEGAVPAHIVPKIQRPWITRGDAHPDTGAAAPELPKAGTAWKSPGTAEATAPSAPAALLPKGASIVQPPQSASNSEPYKIRAKSSAPLTAADSNSSQKPQE